MQKELKISSDRKLFLAIGYYLLVASILLPFAISFGYVWVESYTGPELASRVTFWSFMHVQESLEKSGDYWLVKNTQWLAFFNYWDWWGPGIGTVLPSSVLIPTFILQIVGLFFGLLTLLSVNRVWTTLLLLSTATALNFLYLWVCQTFHAELYIGFWLSVSSTAFVMIAMIWMKKLTD